MVGQKNKGFVRCDIILCNIQCYEYGNDDESVKGLVYGGKRLGAAVLD